MRCFNMPCTHLKHMTAKHEIMPVCKTTGGYKSLHRHGKLVVFTKDNAEVGTEMKNQNAKKGLEKVSTAEFGNRS